MIDVAVIVPAYNEGRVLGACLDSLARQTVPHELVVADDGSTDDTAAVAAAGGARVLRLEHRGPAVARNRGAAETSAPILVFLDADMTFAPDYLEHIIKPITNGTAVGTFTRDEFVANTTNRWVRMASLASGGSPERRVPADHGDTSGAFRAIRRDAFESVGGYDDVGCGEDGTISAKLGVLAVRANDARCWHKNPERLSEIFVNARWYGKSDIVAHTRKNWVRLSPPVVAVRAARTALRHRSAVLAVYIVVHDSGLLAGFVARDLFRRHHAR